MMSFKELEAKVYSELLDQCGKSFLDTYWPAFRFELREAYELGVKEGEEKMARLTLALLNKSRIDDLKAACSVKEKRTQLFKEFGIE